MRRVAATLIILLYPFWSHLVIAAGRPGLSLPGLAVLVLLALSVRAGRLPRSVPAIGAVVAILAAGILDLSTVTPVALYLPPILIPLSISVVFGRTLLPGRKPLVALFAERVMGRFEPARAAYMRGVTWFWTLVGAGLSLEAALLALFADPVTWSLFANGVNYLIMVAAFGGEYVVRCARFGVPERPGEFWIKLAQTDFRRLG